MDGTGSRSIQYVVLLDVFDSLVYNASYGNLDILKLFIRSRIFSCNSLCFTKPTECAHAIYDRIGSLTVRNVSVL